jgi:hypothetical protein
MKTLHLQPTYLPQSTPVTAWLQTHAPRNFAALSAFNRTLAMHLLDAASRTTALLVNSDLLAKAKV